MIFHGPQVSESTAQLLDSLWLMEPVKVCCIAGRGNLSTFLIKDTRCDWKGALAGNIVEDKPLQVQQPPSSVSRQSSCGTNCIGCQEKDQQLKEVTLSLENVKEDNRELLEKEQWLEEVTLSLEAVKEDNSRLLLTCSSLAEQVQHTFAFTSAFIL